MSNEQTEIGGKLVKILLHQPEIPRNPLLPETASPRLAPDPYPRSNWHPTSGLALASRELADYAD